MLLPGGVLHISTRTLYSLFFCKETNDQDAIKEHIGLHGGAWTDECGGGISMIMQ